MFEITEMKEASVWKPVSFGERSAPARGSEAAFAAFAFVELIDHAEVRLHDGHDHELSEAFEGFQKSLMCCVLQDIKDFWDRRVPGECT